MLGVPSALLFQTGHPTPQPLLRDSGVPAPPPLQPPLFQPTPLLPAPQGQGLPPLTGQPPNHSISACSTMSPMPIPASASAQPASHFSCSSKRFRRRRAPRPGTGSPPMAPGVLGLSQLPAQGPLPRSTQRAATVAGARGAGRGQVAGPSAPRLWDCAPRRSRQPCARWGVVTAGQGGEGGEAPG